MRWRQYEYDSLNRLNSAREVLDGGAEQWKQQFTYDRWGNRTHQHCRHLRLSQLYNATLLRWWGSGIKLGALSHACLAWIFCSPLLVAYGVLSPRYFALLYVTMLCAGLMMFFGFQVDKTLQKRND